MLNIAYIADASEQVHFQAKLVLLLLFLRRINSKISKQSTKSGRGYILRLVGVVLIRGDTATQFDSVYCLFLPGSVYSFLEGP